MGGRGNASARNTGSAGSAVANKNVAGAASISEKQKNIEIPKRITDDNGKMTEAMRKYLLDNIDSIPKGTIIESASYAGDISNRVAYRADGNGEWSKKTIYDRGYTKITAEDTVTERGGDYVTYASLGYSDKQTAEMEVRDFLKRWNKLKRQ